MNIIVPSIPPRLRLSPMMVDDFLGDPAMAVTLLLNERLDAFQRVRLKLCWWTPRVIDSSGLGSTKTRNMWWVSVLRCLLIPGQVSGVYYQTWDAGKQNYWKYFREVARKSEFFRAHSGVERIPGVDAVNSELGKAQRKGPSNYEYEFRNGSRIIMPAPGFLQDARSQAGLRFNDLYVDEWTKIEASGSKGIGDQLIGRTQGTRSWNKEHPLWANHHLFLATAEDTMHPAYRRWNNFRRQVQLGNPEFALMSFCYKDYSDLPFDGESTFKDAFRDDRTIRDIRAEKGRVGFIQEALGIWSKNARGWYTAEMLEGCYKLGAENKAAVYCSRSEDPEGEKALYFCGIDPARAETKKADDGALVVLRVIPLINALVTELRAFRLSWCYAYKVRKFDARQWAGLIHQKHRHFGFTGIMMDSGGGGVWIQPELAKSRQAIGGVEQTVRPIAAIEDEQGMMTAADFILCMFRPKDTRIQHCWKHVNMLKWENLIDIGHQELREGLSVGIGFPPDMRDLPPEVARLWSAEKQSACHLLRDPRDGLGAQLMGISVVVDEKGQTVYSKAAQARQFHSRGRKDFAYAAMMAYARFRVWLASGADEMFLKAEDDPMCWST